MPRKPWDRSGRNPRAAGAGSPEVSSDPNFARALAALIAFIDRGQRYLTGDVGSQREALNGLSGVTGEEFTARAQELPMLGALETPAVSGIVDDVPSTEFDPPERRAALVRRVAGIERLTRDDVPVLLLVLARGVVSKVERVIAGNEVVPVARQMTETVGRLARAHLDTTRADAVTRAWVADDLAALRYGVFALESGTAIHWGGEHGILSQMLPEILNGATDEQRAALGRTARELTSLSQEGEVHLGSSLTEVAEVIAAQIPDLEPFTPVADRDSLFAAIEQAGAQVRRRRRDLVSSYRLAASAENFQARNPLDLPQPLGSEEGIDVHVWAPRVSRNSGLDQRIAVEESLPREFLPELPSSDAGVVGSDLVLRRAVLATASAYGGRRSPYGNEAVEGLRQRALDLLCDRLGYERFDFTRGAITDLGNVSGPAEGLC